MACTRNWSRCCPIAVAVAASESTPVDVLKAVANRRDLTTLVEHLNAVGADVGRACCVPSSVPDTGDLLMHHAD